MCNKTNYCVVISFADLSFHFNNPWNNSEFLPTSIKLIQWSMISVKYKFTWKLYSYEYWRWNYLVIYYLHVPYYSTEPCMYMYRTNVIKPIYNGERITSQWMLLLNPFWGTKRWLECNMWRWQHVRPVHDSDWFNSAWDVQAFHIPANWIVRVWCELQFSQST